ncbi:hypothetical protein [Rhodopirellula baltica]
MLNRLRNAIFGELHEPTPASIVVEPTQLVLACDDTSATSTTKVDGKRVTCPYTMWTGSIECRIFAGLLDFQLLVESNAPRERDLDLIRRIVAYERSLTGDAMDAVFNFFSGLRNDHGVDFSAVVDRWSRDSVAKVVHSPSCLIDDLDDEPGFKNRFIVSFSTDLDPEHGVDVQVDQWRIVDCGCRV